MRKIDYAQLFMGIALIILGIFGMKQVDPHWTQVLFGLLIIFGAWGAGNAIDKADDSKYQDQS